MERLVERHAMGILDSVEELAELELVEKASVQIRVHSDAPLFKIYLLNECEVFFGLYPAVEHTVTIDKKKVLIYDPMGKDAMLFHHSRDADPDSQGTLYVSEMTKWFESLWTTIARPYEA